VFLQSVEAPRINLMIQGRTLALFQPPAHIFAVRQFVAIEAVVPPEPAQAAEPANLMPGEIYKTSAPA